MTDRANWKQHKQNAGRMYARVPYRGWVLKGTPDGSSWEPFASGFRTPDGIGVDAQNRLLVTDNQGDWLGTSKVYHVRKDTHSGHVASLVWRNDWDGRNPLKVPVPELEKLRTPAMALLPQGELSSSPTQPIAIPKNTFGPFASQTLIGEMNLPTLVRLLPDPDGETSRAAAIPFLYSPKLGRGNHRLTFSPDGSLWVGKTHLSWAGSEGLTRITLKDKPNFHVETVKAGTSTFTINFNQPLHPEALKSLSVQRHTYHYHIRYGSKKVDLQPVSELQTNLTNNGKTLTLTTKAPLLKNYLYTIQLPKAKSTNGLPLLGDVIYYTNARPKTP